MRACYELIRQGDDHRILGAFFKSVTIIPNEESKFSEFPPKLGDHVVVFNNIFNYWQTTEIQHIIKKSEDEYEFTTLNSIYNIKRLMLDI